MVSTPPSLLHRLRAHRDLVAVTLIIVMTVVVCWPWLGTGQAFYWGDIGLYFEPMLEFLRHELRRGRIPLWNPYIFCGTPYVGNPQTWIFYPSTVLLAFFSAPVYIAVNTALHLAFAGAGSYYFLSRGRARAGFWAALLGACTYMLGGYVVSKSQFPNMVQALAYTPWLLLATERLVTRPRLRRALELGVLLGLQTLAAHAQITLFTGYLMVLYGLWCLLGLESRRVGQQWLVPYGVAVTAVAVGVACVQLLPVGQLAHVSGRQHLAFAEANRFYLPPGQLTNFIWPYRYGGPMFGNWRGGGNFWEGAWYIGFVPCVAGCLAIGAGATRRSRRWQDIVFWTLLLLSSMLLALGGDGPLYPIAFLLLPGMNRFHDPARLLLGAAIAVPVLAAMGLEEALERLQATSPRATMLGVLCLVLTVADLGAFDHRLYPLKPVPEILNAGRQSPTAQILLRDPDIVAQRARVVMADPKAHRTTLYSYHDYQQGDPRILTHWTEAMIQGTNMPVGALGTCGYEPVALKAGLDLRATLEHALPMDKATPHYASLLAQDAGKYLVTFGPAPIRPTPGLKLLRESPWECKGNRVRVYANAAYQLRARLYDVQTRPLLVASLQSEPDQVTVTVPAAAMPRRLVLTDVNYAGWTAFVDGHPAAIHTAAPCFRQVAVPPTATAAPQRIAFVYQPQVFELGLFLTLMTLCGLTAFLVQAELRMDTNERQ